MNPLTVCLIVGFAYLLGSIPFGMVVTKLAGLGDIRQIGSGNIGATNVLRTGKKGLALVTLLLDGGKGAVAVLVAKGCITRFAFDPPLTTLSSEPAFPLSVTGFSDLFHNLRNLDQATLVYAGLAVMAGHLFSVWLGFKGGKGVATAIGVITAFNWVVGIALMLVWIVLAAGFRYSSLAALGGFLLAPLLAFWIAPHDQGLTLFTLLILIPIFWKHRRNIQNLMHGKESKIGGSSRG